MAKERRSEAIWIESRKRWQCSVQRDGKRRVFTSSIPGRKGKHEAEARADDWIESGQPDDIRFDVAWGKYLEYIKRNTGEANYNNVESIGRNWFLDSEKQKRLSMKKLSKIRLADVQEIVTSAGEAGRSKRMCKNIRDKFSGFSKFAEDQGWRCIKVDRVKLPTQARIGEKKVIQPDKLKVLFQKDTTCVKGKEVFFFYIYAIRFLVVTGYRRGELCGFMKDDYDGNALTVSRSVNDDSCITQGKNQNARRTNVLSQHAKTIMQQQQQMLKEHGIISPWLFPGKDGNMLNPRRLYKAWSVYSEQIGIDVSLHELRHTFISIAQAEMPESLLKDIVGHSASMDTKGVYGHEIDGEKQRAANILDSIFDRVLG